MTDETVVLPFEGTKAFYEQNASQYAQQTSSIDMSPLYARFERYIPASATILDAGSGSGRDTKYFADQGYHVTAFDYSPKLASISTAFTGISTKVRRFEEVDEVAMYDGIWACASLLHLPLSSLSDAFRRLSRALKPGGVLYASFRKGDGERCHSDGRCYTDFSEAGISRLFSGKPEFQLVDLWTSHGEGSFEGAGEWLNIIARRDRI